MKIKMLVNVTTSGKKYEKDENYNLEDALAADWIDAGYAEKAKNAKGAK